MPIEDGYGKLRSDLLDDKPIHNKDRKYNESDWNAARGDNRIPQIRRTGIKKLER